MPGDTTRRQSSANSLIWWKWVTVGALAIAGCARPAVLPPTASIGPPPVVTLAPTIEPVTPATPLATVPTPDIGDRQWPSDQPHRDWKYIVLHHTATERGSVESIHETHLRKKDKSGTPWQGIGYHFVIGNGDGMADGEIEPTFRWKQQLAGAHAGVNDFNQHGIGVVLVGNFEKHEPTPAQRLAVKRLVGTLSRKWNIPSDRVVGHGDVKATECPGQYFPLDEIRASAENSN